MKKNTPHVTIGIVTCNSALYIDACISSVLSLSYPNYSVIIFDNASTDQTLQKLQEFKSDSLSVIRSKKNTGFAAAHNTIVRTSQAKYVVVLNPDTTVSKHFLEPLVEKLEKDSNCIAVQPLVYLFDKKTINLTGKVTHYLGFDWIRDYQQSKIPPAANVYSISGSGVCVNKELFLAVGGFDEAYFMYYEDSDFSWRSLILGYSLYFEPKSVMYHDYKYIPEEKYLSLQKKMFLIERNRLATVFKNYSIKSLILLLPAHLFMELGMLLYAVCTGWGKTKFLSYVSLLQLLPHLFQKRLHLQSQRKVDDSEIMKHFVDTITFSAFQNPVITKVVNPILRMYWKIISRILLV